MKVMHMINEQKPTNEEPEMEKGDYWNEQSELANRISNAGGIEKYFLSIPEAERQGFLRRENNLVGCMDEGCRGCGLRIAGSGLLIPDNDQKALLENCQRLGAQGFTHHASCGASHVKAEFLGDGRLPADIAREYSERVANHQGVSSPFIPIEEMARPKEFHVTKFVYYDGTAQLNLTAAKDILPNGFVLTRGLYPKAEQAVAEAELAFKIASGDHGFGELITEDAPFEIIVIGDPKDPAMSLETLLKELEPLRANPKIRISGFTPEIVR